MTTTLLPTVDEMVRCVRQALSAGDGQTSALPADVAAVSGLTGQSVRHFLQALCGSVPDCRYLEVGTYQGATVLAAACNNPGRFVAVDSFCETFSDTGLGEGQIEPLLRGHLAQFADRCCVEFVRADCWRYALQCAERYNVFFYDGAHDLLSQVRAVTAFAPLLDLPAVVVIDDWHELDVQQGTRRGLEILAAEGIVVAAEWERGGAPSWGLGGWWNGLGIFVLEATL